MKLFTSAVAIFPALTMAKVLLAVGPSQPLAIGDTYNVEWLVDRRISLELVLVKQNDNGWTAVETIFSGVESKPCNGSYEWVVGNMISPGSNYGLWINGDNIPNDNSGYADLSDWFSITAKVKELL